MTNIELFCWGCMKNSCLQQIIKCQICKFSYCMTCCEDEQHHDCCKKDIECICSANCSSISCLSSNVKPIRSYEQFECFFIRRLLCVRCKS